MRKLVTTVTSIGLFLFVTPVLAGQVTSLGNARVTKRVEVKKLPRDVQYVFSRDVATGRIKKTSDGADGSVRTTIHEVRVGDKVVAKKTAIIEKIDPKPVVFEIGRAGFSTSRGSFTRSKVMTVEATAYLPTDGSGTGRTATGRKATYGVIAVDPRVIPLHTLVYVEGYGFAIAADTGGAIKGKKIDVCIPDRRKVYQWGRRKVTIHVFNEQVKYKRR